MTAERQESLFGESKPAEATRQPFPIADPLSLPPRRYDARPSSAAYDDLGGNKPEDDSDGEPAQAPTSVVEVAPVLEIETEAVKRRALAMGRAGARIADDQRYWTDLQDRVQKGTLLQGDFMDEWTREMNKRWRSRKPKDES